ncbi:hypothetical protein SEVIR_1G145800v4 [Setaria viridis]|uniref:Uncharacterized protein n=1 Tax=Setaria viridis TaxID=4556 RepID=A0A4U6W8D5_SETVI|nr:uncharacterized protein LOC101769508 isoform X2 [Setaria italica]XP_034586090.1 uncharacterized protein LOC117848683 isoform X2 [Setaria viridis]TKW38950.1 hypothetical protein SEVIR_1G145800v2 [Setaria viridis]
MALTRGGAAVVGAGGVPLVVLRAGPLPPRDARRRVRRGQVGRRRRGEGFRGRRGQAGDADGEKSSAAGVARPAAGFQEHVVVIMGGEERPTFLAIPAASRAIVELGAMPTAPASCGGSGSGEEKKAPVQDDSGCAEQTSSQLRLGADDDAGIGKAAAAARRRCKKICNKKQISSCSESEDSSDDGCINSKNIYTGDDNEDNFMIAYAALNV